ncbi:hypothetical protein GCM10022224_104390 [Nonomuraea antimicrobica]|uniref:Lsr2 protein n=2 Tax=Nonomuraea antimicrobica TaxID=561173 RepID=A0ABP7ET13_9ACTN
MPPRKRPDPRTAALTEQGEETSADPLTPRRTTAPTRGRVATWTTLRNTGTRLDDATNSRMTKAHDRAGKGVRDIWEEAINAYCDKLGVPQEMPEDAELKIPAPKKNNMGGGKLIMVRLTRNTRARLVEGCLREDLGGRPFISDALNDYFDDLGIPRPKKPQEPR